GENLVVGVLQRLDRGVGLYIPIKIIGACRFCADHAYGSAFGIGTEYAHDTGSNADIDTARDHRLLRLARAICVHDLDFQAMLLEDTCKPADFRHRGVPIAALADCQFQLVLSGGRGSRKERQRPKRVNERRFPHRESSLTFYRLSDDLWFFAGALKRRFTTATKASPVRCLRNDPFV